MNTPTQIIVGLLIVYVIGVLFFPNCSVIKQLSPAAVTEVQPWQ